MLKFTVKLIAAAMVTVLLSVVLLVRNLSAGWDAMNVRNGEWVTSVATGSKDAGVMLKAAVAIGGLLASTKENSMYYQLNAIDGKPLSLNCRYRIEGNDYDANWWSITAYGWDNYLIPNQEKRYSFNNENVAREPDGSWTITVAMDAQQGNWLPVGPSGAPSWRRLGDNDFDLLMRLYTPGTSYLQSPQSARLPSVIQEECL